MRIRDGNYFFGSVLSWIRNTEKKLLDLIQIQLVSGSRSKWDKKGNKKKKIYKFTHAWAPLQASHQDLKLKFSFEQTDGDLHLWYSDKNEDILKAVAGLSFL